MAVFSYCKKWIQSYKQHQAIKLADIVIFLRQLATLITAGVNIFQACVILEKCQEKLTMQQLVFKIKREIHAGKHLFSSLSLYSIYFDEFTCQLIKIGEQTGKLDHMLQTIANYQEKSLQFRKQLKQILIYPIFIILSFLIIFTLLLLFVIPKFAELFSHTHIKLSLLTRFLFWLTAQLQTFSYLFLCAITLLLFFIKKFFLFYKKPLQDLLFKIPLLYHFMKKLLLARFTRNLAVTFAAGIPITEAITLSAYPTKHNEFAVIISQLKRQVASGMQLHQALAFSAYFPAIMLHMIKIGEETGMLVAMLEKLADNFEIDVQQYLGQIQQFLEPLIMIILGVLIGGMVIGMYLPIFNLGSTL